MAQGSLGIITPGIAGPIRLTSNQADPTAPVWAHKYRVFPLDNNTGKGYVGKSTMIFATGDDLFGWCFPPTAAILQWPPFYDSDSVEPQQNPFDLSQVYLDADVVTDSFLISYVEA